MIKREHRLKKNKHFNYIYKNGAGVKAGNVSLVYMKSKFKTFKVGFSVSTKIGKSVVRNKVKRRMRAIFNEIYKQVDRRYNYIFVAKQGIENSDYNQIKADMLASCKKAGLINESD